MSFFPLCVVTYSSSILSSSNNQPLTDPCLWYGVSCLNTSNMYSVSSLQVNSSDINGTVPSSLFTLVELQFLDVSDNELSGLLLSEIGYVGFLDLSWNMFHGTIPTSFSLATQLNYLDFSFCQLSGRLVSISSLTYLDISYSTFTGNFPSFGESLVVLCTILNR